MGACGGGYGGLDVAFAERVELELVHAELRDRLHLAPSREVFRAEHAATVARAGAPQPFRLTLERLVRAAR
jgi:hypothetical protein